MPATFYQHYNPAATYARHAERMPSSMPATGMAMSMCANAASSTSAIIVKTGVVTPVSLFAFALLALVVSLLLGNLSLITLISLLLICLTGLVGLRSLVRHEMVVATTTARGD